MSANSVAVFLDVNNLYFCIGKRWPEVKVKLNYDALLKECICDDILYRAFGYGTEQNDEASAFKGYLRAIGIDPRYKKARVNTNGGVYRTDWNIGMTLDVVKVISKVNCVILGSSNPELIPLIEWIQSQGVRCIVYACGIPSAVRKVVDQFIEIDEELLVFPETDPDGGEILPLIQAA